MGVSYVNAVGIMFSRFHILWLQAGFAEQTFYILDTSLKLDGFKVNFFEAREKLCLSNFGHYHYRK